jgi:hypothetical protein
MALAPECSACARGVTVEAFCNDCALGSNDVSCTGCPQPPPPAGQNEAAIGVEAAVAPNGFSASASASVAATTEGAGRAGPQSRSWGIFAALAGVAGISLFVVAKRRTGRFDRAGGGFYDEETVWNDPAETTAYAPPTAERVADDADPVLSANI